jgi:carnitine-CoA ligase
MDYHLDPRMPRPDQCVQRDMIERWARTQPKKTFAIFADGEQWTYAQTQALAVRTANALRALGVRASGCWCGCRTMPTACGSGSD